MTRISTGIQDFDDLIALRGTNSPDALAIDDIDRRARDATISRKTRNLDQLGERPALRHLVVRTPSVETLSWVGGAQGVEDLELCGGTMSDLNPLRTLRNLRALSISVASRLRSLDGVEGLTSLEYFSTWYCAALTNLAPLAGLRGLRYVFLDGNMYKAMRIDSLVPLAGLRELEVLKLHNVRVRDRDLQPLHGLRKLRQLDLPAYFPSTEFAALAVALPAANGGWRSRVEASSAAKPWGS